MSYDFGIYRDSAVVNSHCAILHIARDDFKKRFDQMRGWAVIQNC